MALIDVCRYPEKRDGDDGNTAVLTKSESQSHYGGELGVDIVDEYSSLS